MRTLYLVFNKGYCGDVDLAAEAIRLTRQLASLSDDPEVAGLLALMLLHHARRHSRTRRTDGSCRSPSRTVAVGHRAHRRGGRRPAGGARADRLGEYQAQAAIAALHADAPESRRPTGCRSSSGTTNCSASPTRPIVRLNRAVAVGEADGRRQGWRHWPTSTGRARRDAVAAHLHERTATSNWLPASTPRPPQRTEPGRADHQTRQAARINQTLRDQGTGWTAAHFNPEETSLASGDRRGAVQVVRLPRSRGHDGGLEDQCDDEHASQRRTPRSSSGASGSGPQTRQGPRRSRGPSCVAAVD